MTRYCPVCGEYLGEADDDQTISGKIRFLIRDRDGNLVDVDLD